MDKKLKTLKEEYKNIPIPKELDEIVLKTLPRKKRKKHLVMWPGAAAAAALLLTATVNFSPDVANAMSKVPIMKGIVEVLTFNELNEATNNTSIHIKTPAISGLDDKTLENSVNEKYLEESKKLYKDFTAANKDDHLAINSDFEIITDTPELLSISRSIEITQASGYMQNHYVVIDKEDELLITLKSLFKNDQYITVISENIKEQMRQQMEADPNQIYFISEDEVEPFTQINPDQQFYISPDHKLVIAFDEYEVAPGYMGTVEFEIPTDIISDILVGDKYLQ